MKPTRLKEYKMRDHFHRYSYVAFHAKAIWRATTSLNSCRGIHPLGLSKIFSVQMMRQGERRWRLNGRQASCRNLPLFAISWVAISTTFTGDEFSWPFLPKGALISGVITNSTLWDSVKDGSWTLLRIWYASLIISLICVTSATQQAIALYRVGSVGLQSLMEVTLAKEEAYCGVCVTNASYAVECQHLALCHWCSYPVLGVGDPRSCFESQLEGM